MATLADKEEGEMTKTLHGGKTVQQYIDETPIWPDGTETATTPLTPMQQRIWWLAAAGKFFEGLVVFMTGIALPLIVKEYNLDGTASHGLVTAATIAGILVGASALGGLSDIFGRKRMFIVEMVIFIVFLVALTLTPNFTLLIIFLFGMGLALGCDYPTAHVVISESIPSRARGRLVLGAFAFQAVGGVCGAGIGFLVLHENPSIEAWRWMYATAIIPAVLVLLGRLVITESPHWLFVQGRKAEAEAEARRLLTREPQYPKDVQLGALRGAGTPLGEEGEKSAGYGALFKAKNFRATVLASVPWFLQDLGTYGIGIFTPTILAAAIGHTAANASSISGIVSNDILAAKGSAFIDLLLVVGIILAILLADRVGRITLQLFGFVGCAAGLFIAAVSTWFAPGSTMQLSLIFAGFMLFNFMTNMGPNAQTYLIAGEVFPTRIRGKGAGFAASFAKIGAVSTAFLFPILLHEIGTQILLYILVGTSLLGAVVTWAFRIETKGKSLEAVEF